MPRQARIKSNYAIYHIMVRSIKEIDLFKDTEDKKKYFELIKVNQIKFKFKIYAYCLMDNHGHFMIDANGADISKIMHSINFTYAKYYNTKYDRYGHVFQDRFKSKVVDTKKYLITLSAYIHNNAKAIPGYQNNVLEYKYSSLKCYVENTIDRFQVLDKSFLAKVIGLDDESNKKQYIDLVNISECVKENLEELDIEFEIPNTEYRSERKILARDYSPDQVVDYIVSYTKVNKKEVYRKYSRNAKETRALCAFFMRCFCDFKHKEICGVIGNITGSRVSVLCKYGFELIVKNPLYNQILENFIQIE